jgi:hypothetical protein
MAPIKRPGDPESWYAALGPPQREIAAAVRKILHASAPKLEERILWGMPWYLGKDKVFVVMATGQRINLGFWRGVDLEDPKGLLEGTGKGMRHVKLRTVKEARAPAVKALIRSALFLDK